MFQIAKDRSMQWFTYRDQYQYPHNSHKDVVSQNSPTQLYHQRRLRTSRHIRRRIQGITVSIQDNNTQAPLLRLPAEVRLLIYRAIVRAEDRVLHIYMQGRYLHNARCANLGSVPCNPESSAPCHVNITTKPPYRKARRDSVLSFIMSCRTMYVPHTSLHQSPLSRIPTTHNSSPATRKQSPSSTLTPSSQ